MFTKEALTDEWTRNVECLSIENNWVNCRWRACGHLPRGTSAVFVLPFHSNGRMDTVQLCKVVLLKHAFVKKYDSIAWLNLFRLQSTFQLFDNTVWYHVSHNSYAIMKVYCFSRLKLVVSLDINKYNDVGRKISEHPDSNIK